MVTLPCAAANVNNILLVPVVTDHKRVIQIGSTDSNVIVIKSKDDEGYSTLSTELMNQIKIVNTSNSANNTINNRSSMSPPNMQTNSNTNDTDSGIARVSQMSGDDSTSSPSSSLNHSPISNDDTSSSSKNNNIRIVNNATNTLSVIQNPNFNNSNSAKKFNRKTKRYCFPTLKSFSYYYNNRYYHQFHGNNNSDNQNDNFANNICCKYLSDTDISSLVNQLSSYDKDLSYNVYHLDTLYNNVDYILFNSYASDTELVYNYNRRHGRNQHFLNSNYKLYINDYFNQPYDGEDCDEEEDDDENEEINLNESDFMNNEELYQAAVDPSVMMDPEGVLEYELRDEEMMKYEFELDVNDLDQDEDRIGGIEYNDQEDYYYFNYVDGISFFIWLILENIALYKIRK
jgi:hypothetical protein